MCVGGFPTPQAQPSRCPAAKVEQVKFDATSLHAKPQVAAQQKMVDDGSGEVEVRPWEGRGPPPSGRCYGGRGAVGLRVRHPNRRRPRPIQVWRVENQELVPVEKRWLGHFYGGDCYLVLYTYYVGPKVNRIIYIWQVRPRVPAPPPRGTLQGQGHRAGGALLPCTAPPWVSQRREFPCPGPPSQHGRAGRLGLPGRHPGPEVQQRARAGARHHGQGAGAHDGHVQGQDGGLRGERGPGEQREGQPGGRRG